MNIDALAPALVQYMPVALVIFDAKARVLCHNPLFSTMFGFAVNSGEEVYFGEILEQSALNSFLDEMSGLVKHQQDSVELTCRYLGADRSAQHWMHIHVVPLPQTELFYAVVDEVTNNIDEQQRLQREKEMAIQATRSKSAFLATMSHEIRTPIHTVTGMTELLLETTLDTEQQEYIRQIRFSAEILLGLINDVLDLSKIEAGRLTLEIIDFDLIKVLEDSVDMQGLTAFSKGLEILLQCQPEVPRMVQGDPIRLRQIFTNLLSNAIKFTRRGEVMVRVRVLDRSNEMYRIRCEVQDTGIGISEDKRDLLFQAFSQVDSSTTRRFGGTGLGLSICRSLVHLMDGEIGASSVEGKGSIFWFELPLNASPDQQEEPQASNHLKPDLKILIVDDVASSRQIIRSIIEPYCANIFEAENGPMALAMLRSTSQSIPFDLALVDLEMPQMDGWQFASEVNSDRTINGTRLFLMVPPGKMGGEAKMKLLNWFDDYVSKPIKRNEFLSVLDRNLEVSLDLGIVEIPGEPENVSFEKINSSVDTRQDQSSLPDFPGAQFTVMVAEDHFVNQKLFETILGRLGHRVIVASDGREALEKGLKETPDLIFMDVQMPEMNGFEATQALRQAGFRAPIIAVTANALKGDQDKCMQAGMNDYLSKPFQKSDVAAMIQKWCKDEDQINPEKLAPLPDDPAVFDFQKALTIFMDDRDTLLTVLKEYVNRTSDQLETIAEAIKQQDYRTAGLHAHTIKGSSWNLGINRLGQSAEAIEEACKKLDYASAEAGIPELRRAWANFVAASSKYLRN